MNLSTNHFQVFEGQEVAVVEAMKLQNSLAIAKTGIVSISFKKYFPTQIAECRLCNIP